MKRLFTIDLKDYDPSGKKFYRPSVRGIIFDNDGNIAMVYSQKYHYYKFPGGGIEGNESHIETLARELKEEAGLTLIPESAKEVGEVLRIQKKDETDEDIILVQYNYYYTCEVEDKIGEQDLDDEEKDAEFVLKFVPIEEAIKTNSAFQGKSIKKQMVKREKRVLEILKDVRS